MTTLCFIVAFLLTFSAFGDIYLHWDEQHTAPEWLILCLDIAAKLAGAALLWYFA